MNRWMVWGALICVLGLGWGSRHAHSTKRDTLQLPRKSKPRAIPNPLVRAGGPSILRLVQQLNEDYKHLVEDNNAFALDFYKRLQSQKHGNVFVSPLSLSAAMAMLYRGAKGETATELAKAMHFHVPNARLHRAYAKLLQQIQPEHKVVIVPKGKKLPKIPFALHIANRLWTQRDFALRPDYTKSLTLHYGAAATPLNFIDPAKRVLAIKRINTWVKRETRGTIKKLVGPRAVNASTKLVLTNAIYFKGRWATAFKKQDTAQRDFWNEGQSRVAVPMMWQQSRLRYKAFPEVRVLEISYRGGKASMLLLLPTKRDGLKAVESALSPKNWKKWSTAGEKTLVELQLPKFKFAAKLKANNVLRDMGAQTLFSPAKADLSGIAPITKKHRLSVSRVIHKSFVAVDEEGTEAAAATAVTVFLTGMMPKPKKVVSFHVDRPFLFAIRDNQTKSILFLGRVKTLPGTKVRVLPTSRPRF